MLPEEIRQAGGHSEDLKLCAYRNEMSDQLKHVSVCVCAYKRPDFLKRLLKELDSQDTNGLFTYSVVVVDNDRLRSSEPIVSQFAASSSLPVTYCMEPRQNIALARNKAVESADGDFIAFIDDDEVPAPRWLLNLFSACEAYNVDGVLGPVIPQFNEQPPKWVIKGKFYHRPVHPTGMVVEWSKGRTGNLLFRKRILASTAPAFKPEFRAGEDQDFFRRMIEIGHIFIWSKEAVVFETVPRSRWKPSVMFKRALLRGATARLHPTLGPLDIAKSLIAVPTYVAALPFAALLGQHRIMSLLVRLFDHLGKLLALIGVNPIRDQYVTE